MSGLRVREYGSGPHVVITLHGGPAAAGDVARLARELATHWHVLEPWQRGSGPEPLTVATHVRDLDDLVRERCSDAPVLVGHSWGAMLALAYAAAHPATPAGLVLIGCGTFSAGARAQFEAQLDARLTSADRAALAQIELLEPDADRRLAGVGRLMTRVYGYDVDDASDEVVALDAIAHEQTWADMVRLQNEGVYPAAFAAIGSPVLMLHGDVDPHPGRLTRDDLREYIRRLEYQELRRCGHSPWLERQGARGDFLRRINAWLEARFSSGR